MPVAESRTSSTANFNHPTDRNGAAEAVAPLPAHLRRNARLALQSRRAPAIFRKAWLKIAQNYESVRRAGRRPLARVIVRINPAKQSLIARQAADQEGCIQPQVEADTFAPTTSDIGYVGQLIEST
jgi:hypothetical protein